MTRRQIKDYLERIECSVQPTPDLQTLKQLQKQHLLNIPFENLDIHGGKTIHLDTEKIFEKIVTKNRGGFCYELNGLFYDLLQAIGFDVKRISGCVFDEEKGYGMEYDHLALIAKVEAVEYLVDVGFGEFAFFPIPFRVGESHEDERGLFMFDKYDDEYLRINKKSDGVFKPAYIFKTQERAYEDFEEMCKYHQTNPGSHFLKKRFLGIPISGGRVSINNNLLKIQKGTIIQERSFEEAEFEYLLGKYFKFQSHSI